MDYADLTAKELATLLCYEADTLHGRTATISLLRTTATALENAADGVIRIASNSLIYTHPTTSKRYTTYEITQVIDHHAVLEANLSAARADLRK